MIRPTILTNRRLGEIPPNGWWGLRDWEKMPWSICDLARDWMVPQNAQPINSGLGIIGKFAQTLSKQEGKRRSVCLATDDGVATLWVWWKSLKRKITAKKGTGLDLGCPIQTRASWIRGGLEIFLERGFGGPFFFSLVKGWKETNKKHMVLGWMGDFDWIVWC